MPKPPRNTRKPASSARSTRSQSPYAASHSSAGKSRESSAAESRPALRDTKTRSAKPASKARPARNAEPASAPAVAKSAKPQRRPDSFPDSAHAQKQQPARARIQTDCAVVARRAADRLRSGHLWVYATELEQSPTVATPDATSGAPALIPVTDTRGLLLGTALYSPQSQIPLRLISREPVSPAQWPSLLEQRLRTAIAQRLPLLNADNTACRLVFSEADELPGLILDKYGDLFLLQLLMQPLATEATRDLVARVLQQSFADACPQFTLWERPDPRIRILEGIAEAPTAPLAAAQKDSPASETIFRMNGLRFHYNAAAGQKTGAFLDQKENYVAAARWARERKALGRALDVCTYQGGFALHLAQVCRTVTGVDASRAALEVAEANLALNREAISGDLDWMEADAFTLLRDLAEPVSGSAAARDWDLIVLDPPAFAKSRRAVEGALRGYKELNLRALRMLRPGGVLVTCSCSHHVSLSDLEATVAAAAIDAHRRVRVLERRGAAIDHPVILNLPETEYLKCLICEVLP